MSNGIYGDEMVSSSILGTNSLKKLQEELNKNKRKQVKLIDQKLYYAKSAREKKKKDLKSADLITIKETLNKIYKEYHTKMSTKKITTLEEFQGILLVGLALFDALDSYSLEGKADKVMEYKKLLEEHRKLKARLEKYENYGRKYASAKEIEGFEIERLETKESLRKVETALDDFTKTFFTKIFQDYNNFKDFLSDKDAEIDKRSEILKTLAELSVLDEYLIGLPVEEETDSVYNKLILYKENVKELYIKGDEDENVSQTLAERIEDIMSSVSENGNIINIALHLVWANILIRNNIMRYPAIAEDYETSRISSEIKSIRNTLIDYYTKTNYDADGKILEDELTYENEVPVPVEKSRNIGIRGIGRPEEINAPKGKKNILPEITEKHYDDLFYDLLSLNRNKYLESNNKEETEYSDEARPKKSVFKTFRNLNSPREYTELGNAAGNISFNQKKGSVKIECTFDDFVMISNALQAMEVLNVEGSYNNVINFFESNGEWKQNNKFRLKERYASEFDSFALVMGEVEEIRGELIEQDHKMNFVETKVLFYLLSRLNNDNEERTQAGILLSRKDFFLKIVSRLVKVIKNKPEPVKPENIPDDEIDEGEGIMAQKRKETEESQKENEIKEEYELQSELYMEEQERIVSGIRGLILKIRQFCKIMETNNVEEVSDFEKAVASIRSFKISENENLRNWFQKELEQEEQLKHLQENIIASLNIENF